MNRLLSSILEKVVIALAVIIGKTIKEMRKINWLFAIIVGTVGIFFCASQLKNLTSSAWLNTWSTFFIILTCIGITNTIRSITK